MDEPHDQDEAFADGTAPQDSVGNVSSENHIRTSRLLLEQITNQLNHLQREYTQIRSWLETVHLQLARREAQVDLRLQDAIGLMNQLRVRAAPGTSRAAPGEPSVLPVLHIQTFAEFRVTCNDQVLSLGSSRKGRAIFRYLVTCPGRHAPRDALLETFWPDELPEKAGHKLHIAISTLRQALTEGASVCLGAQGPPPEEFLLFDNDTYLLNPDLDIHLDADGFTSRFRSGQQLEQEDRLQEALAQYEAARSLYCGDYLVEDLYADWAIGPRARLEESYLTLLGRLAQYYLKQGDLRKSISCCREILNRDSFREDAYRQLMCCYSRMGQRNRALREFHACEQVLQQELGVPPMQETIALYERIMREESV